MAPGDFQAGCKLLADGFVAGLTVLANAIWRGIEDYREWRKELRTRDVAREEAHQVRMAAMTERPPISKLD